VYLNEEGTFSGKCPHCNNLIEPKKVAEYKHVVEYGKDPAGYYTEADIYNWYILLCPICEKPIFIEHFGRTVDQYEEPNDLGRPVSVWPTKLTIHYPKPDYDLEGLPEKVRREYEEALKVRNINRNAYAVLIGRVLDSVCFDKGASGKDLSKRLERLRENAALPDILLEIAHGLRLIRNVGAHVTQAEITEIDVIRATEFCEMVLDYLYRLPSKTEALKKTLKRLEQGE
jgi:hypothetical protein